MLVAVNVHALEEPRGSQSIEASIAEEKKVRAELEARYISEYKDYAVKPHETAIILMHGKWGSPPAPLDSNFSAQRFHVVSPLMPWAGASGYDKTYEQALKEINALVIKLRVNGFKKVIIGGQSFGANGALAYVAAYGEVDGLVLFAPGHNPDIDRNWQPGIVSEARKNIKEGRPEQLIQFKDHNDGGRIRALETRSDIFFIHSLLTIVLPICQSQPRKLKHQSRQLYSWGMEITSLKRVADIFSTSYLSMKKVNIK
jgi:pimeloyl-ACP methyl ester carboxylesterase